MTDETIEPSLAESRSREGKTPCGECHLQPGERRDVCGARAAQGGKT